MNFEKTKVICLGDDQTKNKRYMDNIPLEWNPNTFIVLGIEFYSELNNLLYLNLNRKIKEMKYLMKSWSQRNLTPLGKITVLKTLIISKITHILMSLPSENCNLLNDLENFFSNLFGAINLTR